MPASWQRSEACLQLLEIDKNSSGRIKTQQDWVPVYNRNRLDRERLEVYLVQLMLAYRPLLLVGGLLLLGYAVASMLTSLLWGSIFILVAAVPLLLAISYPAVVFLARLGAWIATLHRKN